MKSRLLRLAAFGAILLMIGGLLSANAQFTPNGQYYVYGVPISNASPQAVIPPGIYAAWQVCAPSSQQVNCFFYTGAVPSAVPSTAPNTTFPVGGSYNLCISDNQAQIVKLLPLAGVACAAPSSVPTATVSGVARSG